MSEIVKMSSPHDLTTACDLDIAALSAKLKSGDYASTWLNGGLELMLCRKEPELQNLPDPYLPARHAVLRDLKEKRDAADELRRLALSDFERLLAQRERIDRITLTICFALLVIVPAAVWWANS